MNDSLWRLSLPLVYMASVFVLSSIPGDTGADTAVGVLLQWVSPTWQNLLHVPLYAGLTLTWLWALAPSYLGYRHRLLTAFLLTAAWGVFDEVHQSFVPGRYASWTDIGLNLLGACAVVGYATLRTSRGPCIVDASP